MVMASWKKQGEGNTRWVCVEILLIFSPTFSIDEMDLQLRVIFMACTMMGI